MDTFPPPAPIAAPSPLQMQLQSASIPTMNTNFTIPSMVNTVPMDIDPVAQNNISHSAANPSPSPAAGFAPTPHHPPYAEMISSAIEALKEKDGSSKRAIAKYIEQSYGGLPSTHSSLLSHHLKRLKNSGHLVMVKKSYKLPIPGSVPVVTEIHTLPTSGTPRGRGRPPKPKPDSIAQPGVEGHPFPQPPAQFIGQPAVHLNGQATAQPNIPANPQPVLVALGLVDEPNSSASEKKRPGRPRKSMVVGGGVSQGAPGFAGFAKRGRGRPPGKLVGTRLSKKSPGRPRKPKSVLGPSGPKRGPGRPSKAEPKTMIIPYATNVPDAGGVDQNSIPSVISMTPKPRGRPRKVGGSVGAGAGAGAGVGILSGKRRGRPPKVAGVNIFKKSSARSVGRPRKNSQPSTAASDALIAANGELKRKLDYFHSKVKQSVGMLKPELTHESSVTAIAAVQELEELASMDLNAPLAEEVQHPVAQTQ